MRHRKSGRKLNRNTSHRKAMFKNMIASLIKHGQITTTLPKAKELRPMIERMVTKARIDTVANRRYVFDRVRCSDATAQLFVKVAPRFVDRTGGYTRILKNGFRTDDAAPMAIIEFVDHSIAA